MKPLYIFDLDGTLALIEHRRHLVEGDTKDWRAFFAACVDDAPNWPVLGTMGLLLDAGADVHIWSGRSAEVMEQTLEWLRQFASVTDDSKIRLVMRPEGDFTPDEQMKRGWLDALNAYDRRRLVAVFDDRQKVVDMWRAAGVACFQVAPGGF